MNDNGQPFEIDNLAGMSEIKIHKGPDGEPVTEWADKGIPLARIPALALLFLAFSPDDVLDLNGVKVKLIAYTEDLGMWIVKRVDE